MGAVTETLQVPFFGLDRQYARYRQEFLAIADRVLSSGLVLQGKEVAEFEASVAAAVGRRHVVAVGSCTDALAFALLACGVQPGDEVIVTAFSFFASASPILRVGAIPRFADIDPATFMMDLARLDALVTPRTRAILAVHIFGQTLPMDRVEAFAAHHGIALVEDAAQALGARDGSRPAGSMGRASCFSFDPTKVIGAFGSGGALGTDDADIAAHARALRYHGRDPASRQFARVGFNSQLSSEAAAMLAFKMAHLEEWQAERARIADLYRRGLDGLAGLTMPATRPGSTHNWHKFVVRARERDALAQHLAKRGVATMVHYSRLMCEEPAVTGLGGATPNLPAARDAVDHVLSLPIYPDMTEAEAAAVIDGVRSFYDGRRQ